MATHKLTPAELTEIRYRHSEQFYHINHKGVCEHVGWLLDHVDALEAENQAMVNVAKEFAALGDKLFTPDVWPALNEVMLKLIAIADADD